MSRALNQAKLRALDENWSASDRIRTDDRPVNSRVLNQLSYAGTWDNALCMFHKYFFIGGEGRGLKLSLVSFPYALVYEPFGFNILP